MMNYHHIVVLAPYYLSGLFAKSASTPDATGIGSKHYSADKHSRQTVLIVGAGADRIDFAPVYFAGAIGKTRTMTRAQFFRAYR